LEATRYVNLKHLHEHRKEVLRQTASTGRISRSDHLGTALAPSRPLHAAFGGVRASLDHACAQRP
jgi:hypothetical protein